MKDLLKNCLRCHKSWTTDFAEEKGFLKCCRCDSTYLLYLNLFHFVVFNAFSYLHIIYSDNKSILYSDNGDYAFDFCIKPDITEEELKILLTFS